MKNIFLALSLLSFGCFASLSAMQQTAGSLDATGSQICIKNSLPAGENDLVVRVKVGFVDMNGNQILDADQKWKKGSIKTLSAAGTEVTLDLNNAGKTRRTEKKSGQKKGDKLEKVPCASTINVPFKVVIIKVVGNAKDGKKLFKTKMIGKKKNFSDASATQANQWVITKNGDSMNIAPVAQS